MKQILGLAIVLVGIYHASAVVSGDDWPEEELDEVGFSPEPDPRCHGLTAVMPIIDDCTHYLHCVRGRSLKRKCVEDFHFDRYKYCTLPEDAECWQTGVPETAPPFECPEQSGYFAHPTDCSKFVVCYGGRPEERQCPKNQTYRPFTGCIPEPCTPIRDQEKYTAKIRPY